jgi:hypothetical protein
MTDHPASGPLPEVWAALGGTADDLHRLTVTGPPAVLRSAFPVTAAAAAAVGASLLAATVGSGRAVGLDTRGLAVAVRSERHLRRDGESPGSPFDPLSAFHRTADGWVRLHANYPWHRAAALSVLGCVEAHAPAAIAERRAVELEDALHAAGGVGAAVRTEAEWLAEGPAPSLVENRGLGPAPPRPVRRPRVLDLTRVIAGPVATRTLAAHGADVLRLDPPDRPEIPMQAWDTLPGKRSALLDLRSHRAALEELLAEADVVVGGYRPGALDAFGLAPESLAERHPGLVVVTLSAWGHRGRWAGRRGFRQPGPGRLRDRAGRGVRGRPGRIAGPAARPRHRLPGRRGRAPRAGPPADAGRHPPRPARAGRHRPLAAGPPAGGGTRGRGGPGAAPGGAGRAGRTADPGRSTGVGRRGAADLASPGAGVRRGPAGLRSRCCTTLTTLPSGPDEDPAHTAWASVVSAVRRSRGGTV